MKTRPAHANTAMSSASDKQHSQNPAEIARETIRQLALRRKAPTPDAYREIYEEIAGTAGKPDAQDMLQAFAENMIMSPALTDAGHRLRRAAAAQDWDEYGRQLVQLSEKAAQPSATPAPAPVATALQPGMTRTLQADMQADTLREMLARTLSFAVVSLL